MVRLFPFSLTACLPYIVTFFTLISSMVQDVKSQNFDHPPSKPNIQKDTTYKIISITIEGNQKTKEKTVLAYMKLDTGTIVDSVALKTAERNLLESDLFYSVKILSLKSPSTQEVKLYVLLSEKPSLFVSDIGASLNNKKYGAKTENRWLQTYGTIGINNFRGSGEKLFLTASMWTIRYIGLTWYKPFINSPYTITLSSTIGSYPLLVSPWQVTLFSTTSFSINRKVGRHCHVFSSIQGRYRDYEWKGSDGILTKNGIAISSIQDTLSLPPFQRDSEWYRHIVTSDSTSDTYHWKGYADGKIGHYEDPFTEMYLSLGMDYDRRTPVFNPQKGYFFSIGALTNMIWPFKDIETVSKDSIIKDSVTHFLMTYKTVKRPYIQFSSDIHLFHRGIWPNNTVAYRFRPSIRFPSHGDVYSGMYLGNTDILRGYGSGAFGGYEYHHRLLFSTEYRFRIVELPTMNLSRFSKYDKSLSNLRSSIDGAFLLDCGHVWKDLGKPIHSQQLHQSAAGAGFGIRFLFDSIRRSICCDFVWPVYPVSYLKSDWKPSIHLYLDLLY